MPSRQPIFSTKSRINPIEFRRSSGYEFVNEYEIPADFEVVNLPEDIKVETDFAYYSRTYRVDGAKVIEQVFSGYKRAFLPPERYEEVKNYFDDITAQTKKRVAIKWRLRKFTGRRQTERRRMSPVIQQIWII